MQIRNLGGSGLRVSAVGLGCNNFGQRTDLETSRKVIHKAIDLGITLFDTADIYAGMGGSETVLGTVLGDRRKDIVLATKYSKPMATDGTKQGASRRYIMSAVEASLTRLKTDYIDLYQQHDYDPLTPMEETLRALDDLVRQGKVRYIGNSNFPAWRIAEAEMIARQMNVSRFVSCQDEYSLVVRGIEKDLLPAAQEYKLGLLPFFPLASGLLTGKYKRGAAAPDDTRFAKAPALKDRYVTPRNEDIVEKLQAFAQARGHTMLELAFSWLAAPPASLKRHRRRHPRRTGRAERQGDRLGSERGGDGGDRWDHEVRSRLRSLSPLLTGRGSSVRRSLRLRQMRGYQCVGPDRRTTDELPRRSRCYQNRAGQSSGIGITQPTITDERSGGRLQRRPLSTRQSYPQRSRNVADRHCRANWPRSHCGCVPGRSRLIAMLNSMSAAIG